MKTSGKQGILVIQSMGLGDIFFALPVLKTLRRHFPHEPIYFVTHERHREILELVPEVTEILTYQRKGLADLISLISAVRKKQTRMAVVLNPIFRGSLLAWASRAPVRIGYARDFERRQSSYGLENFLLSHPLIPKNEKMHEAERYLDILRLYGLKITDADKHSTLKVSGSAAPDPHQILINLGAGWAMRQWPAERIARTADYLITQCQAKITFCGGKDERTLAESIQRQMRGKAENLCGRTRLKDLALRLSSCALFITPDTGSLHLAAALGTPTLALFGPGDLEKVRPQSAGVRILSHPIPCSPCRFQYTKRCQNNLCMQTITVDEVLKAACEILNHPCTAPLPQTQSAHVPVKKRKILYLQSTSEIGGSDITLLRTLQALNQNRYEPHIILQKDGPLTASYEQAGAKVHFIPSMRKLTTRRGILYFAQFALGYLPAVFAIKNLILRHQIDLVHTNTIHNLYGFAAAKLAGKLHIWHIREIVMQSRWFAALEYFLVETFSARFLVMDQAIARPFAGKHRGFPSHIRKLYDGLDLVKFKPGVPALDIRKELDVAPETPLVGMVCRLDPWKGVDRFIEAAAKVHRVMPEVMFWICGGEIEGHAGYEEILRKKAQVLGIFSQVLFTGWTYKGEQIADVYRSMNISVQCPRLPEPYGLANLEAMACGIPAVAFDEGGPSELCREGALLVAPQNTDALAQGILRLLKDRDFAENLGKAGRRRTEALFDFQQCTRDLEKIYEELFCSQ